VIARGRRTAALLAAGVTAAAAAAGLALPAAAAKIVIVNVDPPGQGLNDPTPAAPVGGNPGTTRGAQRLAVLEAAAGIWGPRLRSAVDIRVKSSFQPLDCTEKTAVLGFAGPTKSIRDFPGAPVANTFYPIALANALAGTDQDPALGDHYQVEAKFNSAVDSPCTFPRKLYYGLDGKAPSSQIELLWVVVHELTHGLGFLTFVDPATGAKPLGSNDPFMANLYDEQLGKSWLSMTDAERFASQTHTGKLVWTGKNAIANASRFTAGFSLSGRPLMYAPSPEVEFSSVVHWDTSMTPDELLEPEYTVPNHRPELADQALYDMGWVPGPLLLSSDHVGVEVAYRDQRTGKSGVATALPQRDAFGYFYFFDAQNPEVFVKVLDFGPSRPFLLFWGGLTDLEYTVTFSSIATGQNVSFKKPAGSVVGGADASSLLHASAASFSPAVTDLAATPATEMRLSKGRVAVRVDYRDQYDGRSGPAQALPQKDEFGYFAFFDPLNPEVFVKVLDFGADRPYLLFYAGLTDLEYTVHFVNLETGKAVAFTKKAGTYDGGADGVSLPH
jgi:hypothetical protein